MSFSFSETAYNRTDPRQKGHPIPSADSGCTHCLCILDKGPCGLGIRLVSGKQTLCPCDPFPQRSIRPAVAGICTLSSQGEGDG